MFVTDAGISAILVLDSSGAVLRQIGGAGSGPGELKAPRSIAVAHDTLRALDAGNGRIAVFTTSGAAVRTSEAPPGARVGPVALDRFGAGVLALGGRDSALAVHFDALGALDGRFGRPVVATPQVWDFGAIRQQFATDMCLPTTGPIHQRARSH